MCNMYSKSGIMAFIVNENQMMNVRMEMLKVHFELTVLKHPYFLPTVTMINSIVQWEN